MFPRLPGFLEAIVIIKPQGLCCRTCRYLPHSNIGEPGFFFAPAGDVNRFHRARGPMLRIDTATEWLGIHHRLVPGTDGRRSYNPVSERLTIMSPTQLGQSGFSAANSVRCFDPPIRSVYQCLPITCNLQQLRTKFFTAGIVGH